MRIGVFTVPYHHLPFEQALDKLAGMGATAVEIGTGGLPGNNHCPVDELLESAEKRKQYLKTVESRGMIISAFSCPWDPLHPNKEIARGSDEAFRKTARLAQMMDVVPIPMLSGLPAGGPDDKYPNWITTPWPEHFREALDYQWNQVAIPYYRDAARYAEEHGVKIAIEMHPGMLIYNVESLLRLRDACGPAIACNFDPSHLFWNGADPITAIRKLGDVIVHVHGKDTYLDRFNIALNGCNDNKPYSQIPKRAWTFRTLGYGHGVELWKEFITTLRLVGYDHAISIEHEDTMMTIDEGVQKGINALKEVVTTESLSKMVWM